MMKCYKTEIKPTEEQKLIINKTIGVSRFIYNFYIAHNKEVYEKEKKFVSAYDFSKWLNNEYIPQNQEYKWIKEVYSKAIKQSIINAETSFKRFFKHKSKFPKFKKKNKSNVKMYFVKNTKTDCLVERHRIKIPTLSWVRLKEYGYIPTNAIVSSGTISIEAGKYFVSCVVKQEEKQVKQKYTDGIGIDLGIKELAVCSNNKIYSNINKTNKNIKKTEKKLQRELRSLARKVLNIKKSKERRTYQNKTKNVLRVQKLYQRLTNIRKDYTNKVVSKIVKTKPSYITIEDLNIKGMMKNKHLAKAIQEQNLYYFRTILTNKCKENNIELRIANRFYPSSKMCNYCGTIHKDLKLKDRVFKCECGYEVDRDYNASCNLRDCRDYKVA